MKTKNLNIMYNLKKETKLNNIDKNIKQNKRRITGLYALRRQ
jgi:hypothetical protein